MKRNGNVKQNILYVTASRFISKTSTWVVAITLTFACNLIAINYIPDESLQKPLIKAQQSMPVVKEKNVIFYNAFIDPVNVYYSLGVIADQLALWQASRYSNATLYYMQLGETSASFPCPANGKCIKLMQKPSRWEESTLGPLYEFCQQNTDHTVIYLHSKGTLNSIMKVNHPFRKLLTLAALSDECYDGLHSLKCNICSARFTPVPVWHNSGNMWITKCSFVKMHYPIMEYEPKVRELSTYYLNNLTNYTDYPEWAVGIGRFANEHWIHSHPQVKPCDVYTDLRFVSGYPYELAEPGAVIPPFSVEKAPRQFPELPHLFLQPLPGPQVRLSYRLYELEQLYGALPANDSFAWTWYKKQEQDLL